MYKIVFFIFSFHAIAYSFQLTYGGLSIECKQGCGDLDSRDMQEIGQVFYQMTLKAFPEHLCLLTASYKENYTKTWETDSYDEFIYTVYDWERAKGFWKENCTNEISIISH